MVWSYTPRQIQAYVFIAHKRMLREYITKLSMESLASRGAPKELKRQLRDWKREL